MKRDLHPGGYGAPAPHRPDPLAAALGQAEIHQAERKKKRAALQQALLLGGFAVIAGFAYRDWLAPTPQAPPPAAVASQAPPPASNPVAPQPVEPANPVAAPASSPAVEDATTPLPPPATPAPAATAVAAATAAERLAAEPAIVLVGPEAQRAAATRRDGELLDRAVDGKAWAAYRGLLGKSIKAALAKLEPGRGVNRFDPAWNNAVLYQAILRWKTLGCFAESDITPLVFDRYSAGMLLWLLHDNAAMEELLMTILPKDDSGNVLKFLMEAWPVNEDKYAKYFSLAVACAVVFDRPLAIPHPVGKVKYGVESTVNSLQRYLWYVDKNEKGKLAAPVHHSSARDLIWVVCAPITTSEMEWSLDKMQLRRKNWGQAYGMITYLMERAANGLNPYQEYSFSEILKEGGICGDQSYFCVNTARAQGIPAMTIAGETNSGPHAWAGVKIDSNEWTTGVGRIGGASKGEAGNPQTGRPITEQEILLWNDRFHQSPVVTLSVWRHLWLADFFAATDNAADHAATVHLANSLGHTFVETWQALYSLLERQTQPHRRAARPEQPRGLEKLRQGHAPRIQGQPAHGRVGRHRRNRIHLPLWLRRRCQAHAAARAPPGRTRFQRTEGPRRLVAQTRGRGDPEKGRDRCQTRHQPVV